MLSYATLFLLRAEETVFGLLCPYGEYAEDFPSCAAFLQSTAEEFKLSNRFDAEFFDKLIGLRNAPYNQEDFELRGSRSQFYLGRLRKMQKIVRTSCEWHLFYLEHGKTRKEMIKLDHLDAQPMELPRRYASGRSVCRTCKNGPQGTDTPDNR